MAAIERTAYPQFRRTPVVRELVRTYTPTDAELEFVTKRTRQPGHRLLLTVLLKTFQRLGYFCAIEEIPPAVIRHIRGALKLRAQVKLDHIEPRTLYRYHAQVRAYLGVREFSKGGLDIATRAVVEAAAAMDNPADLINVAIEQLVRDRIELPSFSTLDRLTRRIRALINGQYFRQISSRLTLEEKQRLDDMLMVEPGQSKSPLQRVKRLPKRGSLTHFLDLLEHISELDSLIGSEQPLADIPELKRRHFAAEARA